MECEDAMTTTRKTLLLIATLCAAPLAAPAQDMTPGTMFLQNWDTDGDGVVTLAEATARRDDLFTAFDADEDGFLSAEEREGLADMRDADRAMMQDAMGGGGMGMGNGQGQGNGRGQGNGQGKGNGQGMGGQGMGGQGMGQGGGMAMDADGDGRLSRAEFTGLTDGWLARKDRNGDGQVTAADFGA
jgi:hypothetical protein